MQKVEKFTNIEGYPTVAISQIDVDVDVLEAKLDKFVTELAETERSLCEITKFVFLAQNKHLDDSMLTGFIMKEVTYNGHTFKVCTCISEKDVRDFRADKLNRIFA